MLTLKKLKTKVAAPVLTPVVATVVPAVVNEEEMPILDAVNDEEDIEVEDAPRVDYYIPKRTFAQILDERAGVKITGVWSKQIEEIEKFFSGKQLPKTVQTRCGVISDVSLFVRSHIDTIKNYNGNKNFQSYLDRLNELKLFCDAKEN